MYIPVFFAIQSRHLIPLLHHKDLYHYTYNCSLVVNQANTVEIRRSAVHLCNRSAMLTSTVFAMGTASIHCPPGDFTCQSSNLCKLVTQKKICLYSERAYKYKNLSALKLAIRTLLPNGRRRCY